MKLAFKWPLTIYGHTPSSYLDYVLYATSILKTSWIESVNFMNIKWSVDDKGRGVSLFYFYFAPSWPLTQFWGNFQTWHPPFRVYTCRNTINIDTSFYAILQSKVNISFFCLNRQTTIYYKTVNIKVFFHVFPGLWQRVFVILVFD